MVSFRFHLVSLVAVFLALALGIGMGVTVIDRATVDLLQTQLDGVRQSVDEANRRSSQLQTQIDQGSTFTDAASKYLIDGQLDQVGVTVIRVQGIDTSGLDQLNQAVQDAGGTIRGTITINSRMALTDEDDLNALRQALEASSTDAAVLRQAFIARVSAVMAGSQPSETLTSLIGNGFLSWSAGQGGNDLAATDFSSSRIVVASGAGASVTDTDLTLPLVRSFSSTPARRAVAVETGVPASATQPEVRAQFVGPIRSDGTLQDLISTVDDLELPSGRVATVLALAQLPANEVGHYGIAGSASAPIPPLSAS